MRLTTFFDNMANRGSMYTPKGDDTQVDAETPMLHLIPVGLVEWMLTTPRTPWDLHKKIMAIIAETGESSMPIGMEMCLYWCLNAGMVQVGTQG